MLFGQDHVERYEAGARDATAGEQPDIWKTMAATWPQYDDDQEATDRRIPVVVLERT